LLEFAGMDPVRVPALPVEQHIAESAPAWEPRGGSCSPCNRA
jgi:hypothetical protein